jgi:hypothetical protein
MMPAHEQLRAAIRARPRSFLFTDDGMTRQIESFFGREQPGASNVIALHRQFAEIVRERSQPQGRSIRPTQSEYLRHLSCQLRDPFGVRVSVIFKFVRRCCQTCERLMRDWVFIREFHLQGGHKA